MLSKETPDNSQKKLIELFVSSLWDLGLEIGHSVRNIKESKYFAKEDIRNMTNLLESRFLAGDKEMDKSLNKIINQRGLWGGHTFFKTKLKEQDLTSLLQTMISRNWIESKEHDLGTITRTSYIISKEGRIVFETIGKFNNSI